MTDADRELAVKLIYRILRNYEDGEIDVEKLSGLRVGALGKEMNAVYRTIEAALS